MASLAKIRCLRLNSILSLKKASIFAPAVRTYAAAWNKDWKPGPYPKTEAERAAAAKRYGLRPEDYEPYSADGFGHGDYPKLPIVSEESKYPYEDFDIPEIKRNFGEPMHVDADALKEAWWNPNIKWRYSMKEMHFWFFAVVGVSAAIYLLVDPYPIHHQIMPKQYPEEGVTHYTFEPAE